MRDPLEKDAHVATKSRNQQRFGIGEWYGRLLDQMPADERRATAEALLGRPKAGHRVCPFQGTAAKPRFCRKSGGVCSLRLYVQSAATDEAVAASGEAGRLRTVCPRRFEQAGMVRRWVGQELLGCQSPMVVREVGFLQGAPAKDSAENAGDTASVSRIDEVLVVPGSEPLQWCALEVQAVYFEGGSMAADFASLAHAGAGIPFPVNRRQPDYRSSGPKRLMPQLQIKVPSLRRWGKKMAVVVDQDFFSALAPMAEVGHVSNCDIAWFVVGYEEAGSQARLVPTAVHLTTLEEAVEGLTAGIPVSLETFEDRIREKLARAT